MRFDLITLFPEMFEPLKASIIGRAAKKGVVEIVTHQLRDWGIDKHGNVDDSPYGGGPGMVLRVDVVEKAIEEIKLKVQSSKLRVILPTADGKPFTQADAERLSTYDRIIILCPHYEGMDERARSLFDEELSIGDYVLTGGELPAMVIVDAVTRLLPGVLGKEESAKGDTFSLVETTHGKKRLLEYPQYTRPEVYKGKKVPQILLSGHHAEIERWRREQSLKKTQKRRPDLLSK